MKFGIKLPHSGALAGVRAIRRVAVEAEELGYDSVWVHDHITYDTDWFVHRSSGLIEQTEGIEPHFYESLLTLTYVAGFTEKIKLGTAILVLPLRDPRVLARQAMTLQSISNGRLLLGVGLGDYPSDFRVMGIPYKARFRLTDEYLAILSAILQGGNVSSKGSTISFDKATYFPRTSPIPLLMGGGIGYRPEKGGNELYAPTLRRLAKWCHGWIPEGPPRLIGEGIRRINEMARELGRGYVTFETTAYAPMYLAEDEVARKKTRRSLEVERFDAGRGLEESLIGSPATVSKTVEAYEKAGATAVGIRSWAEDMDSFISMMRTFAKEVMPSFR